MIYKIPSKEEAFRTVVGERNIPIDLLAHSFRFRRRWFILRNQCSWSTFLPSRFPPDQPYNILTIGVFEAMAEVWLMQNIACHPKTRLICIDPWAATGKLDQDYMDLCFANAQHNLFPWKDQITILRGFSQRVLKDAIEKGNLAGIPAGSFDLLYIDGAHEKDPVLQDALACLKLAKKGGWLLFDDVRNNRNKSAHVREGLEEFLKGHGGEVRPVWSHRFCECFEKV